MTQIIKPSPIQTDIKFPTPQNQYEIDFQKALMDWVKQVHNALTNTDTVSSTIEDPVLNGSVTGTGVLDEDNMASDSATKLATQQSIKAYVDSNTGGLILLSVATASNSATVEFVSNIDSTYEEYIISFTDVIPVTDGSELRLRSSTDGGTTFDSTANDYFYAGQSFSSASSSATFSTSEIGTYIPITNSVGNASGETASGIIRIFNPSGTNFTQFMIQSVFLSDTPRLYYGAWNGSRQSAADVDALQIYFSSGNVSSGNFKLYGVKKS